MPLWRVFHPAGLYTEAEKADFSAAITKQYASLPDFYVVVIFTEIDESSCFVAGKPRGRFVRIRIDQIARKIPEDDYARKDRWMGMCEDTIAPWVKEKAPLVDGWEIAIDESSRDLWRIDGMSPPMPNSEGEALWKKMGKAVPYKN